RHIGNLYIFSCLDRAFAQCDSVRQKVAQQIRDLPLKQRMFPPMWTHFNFAPTIEFDLIWEVLQPFVFANFQPVHAANLSRSASHASCKQCCSFKASTHPSPTPDCRDTTSQFREGLARTCRPASSRVRS